MTATSLPGGGGLVASNETGVGEVMASRGCTAVLLLFAVLAMHGLQCGSAADRAAHAGAVPVVSVAPPADGAQEADAAATRADPPAADHATSGAAPDGDHGDAPDQNAGHLWAVCLAVLAAGLAVLLALPGARLMPQALTALAATLSRSAGALPFPRPPDLHALCLLRT